MRRIVCIGAAICIFLLAAPPVYSQSNELLQGTQLRLSLQHGLSSSVAKQGDPFTAVVVDPVYAGNQLILPAGARVNGEIGVIGRPRRFAMFRGQAYMNLHLKSIEVEHREIPAAMSILAIYESSSTQGSGKARKDVRTVEGAVVEAKRDIRNDVTTVALSTAGGTAVGAVFSHVVRGTVIGLAGSAAYIVIKKGKEVELPANTGFLVRLDNTVQVPAVSAVGSAPAVSGQP